MTPEDWQAVLETNLTSCFNMCRAVIGNMRARKYGRIINISSITDKGTVRPGQLFCGQGWNDRLYKGACPGIGHKNVTVNTVCPGYIETDMTAAVPQEIMEKIISQIPEMRMGKPEEIAAIVSFLASDKAAFVTGATISANGGQYMA